MRSSICEVSSGTPGFSLKSHSRSALGWETLAKTIRHVRNWPRLALGDSRLTQVRHDGYAGWNLSSRHDRNDDSRSFGSLRLG